MNKFNFFYLLENEKDGLSEIKSHFTCNDVLAIITLYHNIDSFVIINNENFKEAFKDCKKNLEALFANPSSIHSQVKTGYVKILADVFEAIIAAIFIDSEGDLGVSTSVVLSLSEKIMLGFKNVLQSPLTRLSKICSEYGLGTPSLR